MNIVVYCIGADFLGAVGAPCELQWDIKPQLNQEQWVQPHPLKWA